MSGLAQQPGSTDRNYSNTSSCSSRLLSMTAEELSAFLDEAQAENPLIELTRNREPYEQELSVGRWLGNLAPERPEYSANDDDLTVPDIPCADTERLEDHLRMQIQFSRLPAQLCTAVQYLIGNLDEKAGCRCRPNRLPQPATAARHVLSRPFAWSSLWNPLVLRRGIWQNVCCCSFRRAQRALQLQSVLSAPVWTPLQRCLQPELRESVALPPHRPNRPLP